MKLWKKMLAATLVAGLSFGLVGCGDKKASSDNDDNGSLTLPKIIDFHISPLNGLFLLLF